MRWIVLDEIIEIVPLNSAAAKARVPDEAVSRELLLLEMMAQTGGICVGAGFDFKRDLYFAKIESARFAENLPPGMPVSIHARVGEVREEGAWCDAEVRNGRECLASAKYMLIQAGNPIHDRPEAITFPRAFLEHFRIFEKIKKINT